MYKWAVRRMIRRSIDALGRGDIGPTLAGYADDAVLVFPGQGSRWSGEHRGKRAIEAFLRSFLDAGIVGEAHDILVNGPPWRTTVCVLFTDRTHSAAGDIVLREPGHPVRSGGVGKDRLPRGLRGHPAVRGVRSLPGRTVVGPRHVKGSGASPSYLFIILVATSSRHGKGPPVATGGPLVGVTLSDRQWTEV